MINPRWIPTAAEALRAARSADLERRADVTQRHQRIRAVAGAPAAPGTVTTNPDADTVVKTMIQPAAGAAQYDTTNNRIYFFNGTVWKYAALT
jgi:hypothetical protein